MPVLFTSNIFLEELSFSEVKQQLHKIIMGSITDNSKPIVNITASWGRIIDVFKCKGMQQFILNRYLKHSYPHSNCGCTRKFGSILSEV
ncbi:hypothetical protein WA026_008804 [Henosepilachna vigintioctopunctata]|uniref:Uncharacterized protein n=1 Tax=Henosepilachna vigintioctopunctata TaxID=420089 RepID=A0AAW1V2U2_9CUCU